MLRGERSPVDTQVKASPAGQYRERPPPGGRGAHGESKWVHHVSAGHELEIFVPLGSYYYGMGWTRCFLKVTKQLPKLLSALGGSTSQPISSFPRLDWQASLVQHLPLCHFDFHGTCACLPLSQPQSDTRERGEELSFFYPIILPAFCAFSIRISPTAILADGVDSLVIQLTI